MLTLPLLIAATLLTPVAQKDKVGCKHYKPFKTQIQINVDIPPPKYNHEQSRQYLTQMQSQDLEKWKTQHEDHVWSSKHLTVEGLARGGVGIQTQASFIGKPYDRYGQYYCPYIKQLKIDVHYNTLIHIASDIPKNTCNYDVTYKHENEHHAINVGAVNEVLVQLKKDLPEIIAFMERRYVPSSEVQGSFQNLKGGINDAIKIYSQEMFDRMNVRNAQIDRPQEYQRLSEICTNKHLGEAIE